MDTLEYILKNGDSWQTYKLNFNSKVEFDPTLYATKSEENITNFMRKSMLNYWVIPNPYKKDKNELCDVLVIFQNNVIVISDKSCGKPEENKELHNKWLNFCDQLSKSKKQLKSAQTYIENNNTEIFYDKDCKNKVVHNLDIYETLNFHLITTVSNWTQIVKKEFVNDGSMKINTNIEFLSNHIERKNEKYLFTLQSKPDYNDFFHMFDEINFCKIIKFINTPNDLISYLEERKQTICRSIKNNIPILSESEDFFFIPFMEKQLTEIKNIYLIEKEYINTTFILKTLDYDDNWNVTYNQFKKYISQKKAIKDISIDKKVKLLCVGSTFYDFLISYISIMCNKNLSFHDDGFNQIFCINEESSPLEIKHKKDILDKFASLNRLERIYISTVLHMDYLKVKKHNEECILTIPLKDKNFYFYFYYSQNFEYEEEEVQNDHDMIFSGKIDNLILENSGKQFFIVILDHPNGIKTKKISFYAHDELEP